MPPSLLTIRRLRLTALALVTVLAAAIAIAAQPVAASHSPLPTSGLAPLSADFEEEEAEGEGEDGAEEEWEEEEEAEPVPDEACPLRRASDHAVIKHDKLKLTIGYTTNEPFSARITIQRGAVQIVSARRYLGHSGILRFSERLDEKGGKKLVANIAASNKSTGCPSRRLVLFPR